MCFFRHKNQYIKVVNTALSIWSMNTASKVQFQMDLKPRCSNFEMKNPDPDTQPAFNVSTSGTKIEYTIHMLTRNNPGKSEARHKN